MNRDAYIKLSAKEIKELKPKVLMGIERCRDKARQEHLEAHEEWKKRYNESFWFTKLFTERPPEHPRDVKPQNWKHKNYWAEHNYLSKDWESFINFLAKEDKDTYISVNDLNALKSFLP